MAEVEVGFKVKQKQFQCVKILKKAGYKQFWKAKTHDVYFSSKQLLGGMTEQELKFCCVRIRCSNGGYSVDNFNLYDKTKEDKFKCTKAEAEVLAQNLIKNGFKKVFDTSKTDLIFKKGNSYHQLQKIKGIGLLDYFYNEDIKDLQEGEQFNLLLNEMKALGFKLEYEEGVDKLRTRLNGRLCFSKNQNGNYTLNKNN